MDVTEVKGGKRRRGATVATIMPSTLQAACHVLGSVIPLPQIARAELWTSDVELPTTKLLSEAQQTFYLLESQPKIKNPNRFIVIAQIAHLMAKRYPSASMATLQTKPCIAQASIELASLTQLPLALSVAVDMRSSRHDLFRVNQCDRGNYDGNRSSNSPHWDHVQTVPVCYLGENELHPEYVKVRLLDDLQYPPLSNQAQQGRVWLTRDREISVRRDWSPNSFLAGDHPILYGNTDKDLDFSLDTLFWDMQVELIYPKMDSIVLFREHKAVVSALLPFLQPVLVDIVLKLLKLGKPNTDLKRLLVDFAIREQNDQ